MTNTLTTIVIDSARPAELASFYQAVTGWQIASSGDDFAALSGGPVQLAFQYVEGYTTAGWPGPAKHMHLDFEVADLELAEKQLLAAGATKPGSSRAVPSGQSSPIPKAMSSA